MPLIWIRARHVNFPCVLNARRNNIPGFDAADAGNLPDDGCKLAGRCRFTEPYFNVPALLVVNRIWYGLEACHNIKSADEYRSTRRQ